MMLDCGSNEQLDKKKLDIVLEQAY
jgi:cleavage and polyadenylation specificity factor subunit 2